MELILNRSEKEEVFMAEARNEFLRLIPGSKTLRLDACDGTEILANAKDIFADIDPNFKDWSNGPEQETAEMPIEIHEMIKDATFLQMFGSLSSDIRRLCLTQHQVKNFVKKYRGWLHEYSTFILLEWGGLLFVAFVGFASPGKLRVYYDSLNYFHVWFVNCRHRIVVPQLT